MNQPSPQIPIQGTEEPSLEGKRLLDLFNELESKQLDFLDESGKSIIERTATFLAVLFGVTVLSSSFPPLYLKSNVPAKICVILTLILYLGAMSAGMWAIQPRSYRYYQYNRSRLERELEKMIHRKRIWLRIAGVLFVLGSIALAILIIAIIWSA